MNYPWDLEELCQRAGDALASGAEPGDARVRARPDARTVRYYTTLGLIDRPDVRGRSGFYGRRHLLQVVAIKRLQGEGASLAEIQARLLGLHDDALASIARLPAVAPGKTDSAPSRSRGHFWEVRPVDEADRADGQPDKNNTASNMQRSTTLNLATGTLLVLPTDKLDQTDVDALRDAAGPLLAALRERGLLND